MRNTKAKLRAFLQTDTSLQRRNFHFLRTTSPAFSGTTCLNEGFPFETAFISLLLSQTGLDSPAGRFVGISQNFWTNTANRNSRAAIPPAVQRSHRPHTLSRLLPNLTCSKQKSTEKRIACTDDRDFCSFFSLLAFGFQHGGSCSCTFGRVSFLLFSDSRRLVGWLDGLPFSRWLAVYIITLSSFLFFFFFSIALRLGLREWERIYFFEKSTAFV